MADGSGIQACIDELWRTEIVDRLRDYISIPSKSPHFDPDWEAHGYIEEAVTLIAAWCKRQPLEGLQVEVVRLPGRTPLLYLEVPASGTSDDTLLFYGHLDKQPEMSGWREGLGPWSPVIEGEKLYGRGGADDGYAVFASLAAILAVRRDRQPHARCVILIEACEESGSYDLPAYIEHLRERIGRPDLVICLDSGAGNYEQLWVTTSLRGLAAGTLRVDIVREGLHSGYGSGIVPSSFRLIRQLLDRLEDARTGRILPEALHAEVPAQRLEQLRAVAELLGERLHKAYPFVDGAQPMGDSALERLLRRNWEPALSVTGAEGLPPIADAGNVLRPYTALKLSLRLPPTVDGDVAIALLKELLERDPPHGARVSFTPDQAASGWDAPATARWLDRSLQAASRRYFDRDCMYMGEGYTIPFMAMLGRSFPEAQFLITGVLGPGSNAHGPNEFLHMGFARKLTACVAQVIMDHFNRHQDQCPPP